MASQENDFGILAGTLAQWRAELCKVAIPDNGASFVHLQSRHAALWATKVLLTELATINGKSSARQDNKPRSIVYVLPNAASVETATAALWDSPVSTSGPPCRLWITLT